MSRQVSRKKQEEKPRTSHPQLLKGVREGVMVVLLAVAAYILIALFSYNPQDPSWSHKGFTEQASNSGGVAGAWLSDIMFYLFGWFAYLFPVLLIYGAVQFYREQFTAENWDKKRVAFKIVGFLLTLAAGSAFLHLKFSGGATSLPANAGGILGDSVSTLLVAPFSEVGAGLFLVALFLAGVTVFTGLSWLWLMDTIGRHTFLMLEQIRYAVGRLREYFHTKQLASQRKTVFEEASKKMKKPSPRIEPVIQKVELSARAQEAQQRELFQNTDRKGLPSLALLEQPSQSFKGQTKKELEAISRLVELKLQDFNIDVEVVAVHPGPVITRFELQPAPGVKVSQVTNLAKDLARSLAVISVRVVEVIPGKPYIGLEIPNEEREMVRLGGIIASKAFAKFNSPLTMALGKDISGRAMAVDLAKMPHLLVAGTTGSGKSVALNAMIVSMLYNATPEQVRMIMIDPKMLELSVYQDIPHLLSPVVTDMKDAANAFRWCVAEMERRYQLMAALGTRNLAGYNRKVKEAIDAGEPIPDPTVKPGEVIDEVPMLGHLPFIVVIVDELADMMMVVGKKVEELIARLAQKARACGIHLILATQRPSVDVLTGLIKANIPTRIAFQVSSRIDSRTVLDQQGAEQLLGHGDMLYLPPGTAVPSRVHGAFVDDSEVHRVVSAVKELGEPEYIDEILEGEAASGLYPADIASENGEVDELYDMGVRIVTETRRASVSGIQRRLKIGYNRAARMVEDMERSGVVGPVGSNGMREVLAPPPPEE